MALRDILPEKDVFLLWSEKNLDFCIDLLEQAEGWYLGYNRPNFPYSYISIREHYTPDRRNYRLMSETSKKRYCYLDVEDLRYWRRWVNWDRTHFNYFGPEPEDKQEFLKHIPPGYGLVYQSGEYVGVWHIYDVEGAEEHGVRCEFFSYPKKER